jgi:hypothetical protein
MWRQCVSCGAKTGGADCRVWHQAWQTVVVEGMRTRTRWRRGLDSDRDADAQGVLGGRLSPVLERCPPQQQHALPAEAERSLSRQARCARVDERSLARCRASMSSCPAARPRAPPAGQLLEAVRRPARSAKPRLACLELRLAIAGSGEALTGRLQVCAAPQSMQACDLARGQAKGVASPGAGCGHAPRVTVRPV